MFFFNDEDVTILNQGSPRSNLSHTQDASRLHKRSWQGAAQTPGILRVVGGQSRIWKWGLILLDLSVCQQDVTPENNSVNKKCCLYFRWNEQTARCHQNALYIKNNLINCNRNTRTQLHLAFPHPILALFLQHCSMCLCYNTAQPISYYSALCFGPSASWEWNRTTGDYDSLLCFIVGPVMAGAKEKVRWHRDKGGWMDGLTKHRECWKV